MRSSFRLGIFLGVLPLCAAAFAAGRSTAATKLVVVEREAVPVSAPPSEAPRTLPAPVVSDAPVASAAPRAEPPVVPLRHAPRCDDVALRGVLMAQEERASLALVSLGGETSWRTRGERIGHYRLFHVGPDRAWLVRPTSDDGYALCQVELGQTIAASPSPASSNARSAASPSVATALPLAHLANKIERRGDGDLVLDRSVIDELAAQQGALASLVRAQPEIEGGRTVGLVLQTVKPGSVLEKLGLKSGDRLRRAAGVDLTGVDAGLTAFARLRTMQKFSIDVVRDGATKSIDYEVR